MVGCGLLSVHAWHWGRWHTHPPITCVAYLHRKNDGSKPEWAAGDAGNRTPLLGAMQGAGMPPPKRWRAPSKAHSTLCAFVTTRGWPSGPCIITPLLRLLWLLPRCHGWL